VREAHPTDGWRMTANDKVGITVKQPCLEEERFEVAKKCTAALEISMPVLVDEMDDRVGHAYSGMPDRLYIIDRDGKVAYKGGRGPFGFKIGEMEQSLVMTLLDQNGYARIPVEKGDRTSEEKVLSPFSTARVPVLSDAEAWQRLPPLVEGKEQPLPHWARAFAGALPRTTAYMLELDDLHRTKSPLDPELRAWLRYWAALANRCDYARAYAEADLLSVLPPGSRILSSRRISAEEHFATKMCTEAASVTDEEVADLIKRHGEEKFVAMVALLAYANFQDRLILSLGIQLEPGGPLKPLGVKFSRQPAEGRAVAPPRKPVEAPAKEVVADRVVDRDWLALKFHELQSQMEGQRERQARIRVPTWEEVKPKLPPGYPATRPSRVRWSLVCMGYQPELSGAWLTAMRTFGQEAKQDRVFEESLFWVITRSLHCFY
jgi:hypothetical protein